MKKEVNEPWTCENCDTVNEGNTEVCIECGLYKDSFNIEKMERIVVDNTKDNELGAMTNANHTTYNNSEKILAIIASITLWGGMIISVICIIGGIAAEEVFILMSFIPVLLTTLVTWAIIKVLCNISNNLREINQKTHVK